MAASLPLADASTLPKVAGLKPAAINFYLQVGPKAVAVGHRLLAKAVPARRVLEFYWSAACPYSYLMTQQLLRLSAGGDLPIAVRLMSLGSDAVNPSPELRQAFGPRDCANLAAFYDVDFPYEWTLPSSEAVTQAQRIVAKTPTLETCAEVGRALWDGDDAALGKALSTYGEASDSQAEKRIRENEKRQRSRGHYHPGTIRYYGEWFEGPMRIDLVAERAKAAGHTLSAPWSHRPQKPVHADPTAFEFWFSFRSPYSYLAIVQLQQWRDAGEIFDIVFRPVLPMVMRGLPVPTAKKMFLVKDAAREARRLQIPFGRIADPVGVGAERCLAVCAALIAEDSHTKRAFDFAVAATKGIWSEGIDVSTDEGLASVAARAGISRDEVMAAGADLTAGADLAESNRKLMFEAGVWGVPCFRCGPLVGWGQDRLQLLRHALGLAAS